MHCFVATSNTLVVTAAAWVPSDCHLVSGDLYLSPHHHNSSSGHFVKSETHSDLVRWKKEIKITLQAFYQIIVLDMHKKIYTVTEHNK